MQKLSEGRLGAKGWDQLQSRYTTEYSVTEDRAYLVAYDSQSHTFKRTNILVYKLFPCQHLPIYRRTKHLIIYTSILWTLNMTAQYKNIDVLGKPLRVRIYDALSTSDMIWLEPAGCTCGTSQPKTTSSRSFEGGVRYTRPVSVETIYLARIDLVNVDSEAKF